MSRMRGVWRLAGSVVVVGLLVGGCTGDDPEPVRTSTAPVEVEPTPSPSPTRDLTKRPERPAAMDEPTTDGAIAAATYVLDLFPYTHVTTDVGPWRAMTSDTCAYCVGVLEDVREIVADGHSVTGGAIDVLDASAVEIGEDRWFSVDVTVAQEPARRVDSDGMLVSDDPGGEFVVLFALSWDNGWLVDEMGIQSEGEPEG